MENIRIKNIKPNDDEIQQLTNIYKILEEEKLRNIKFIPTNFYGKLENGTVFTVLKDKYNTNKICIIFFEINNAYIIYLGSTEKGYEVKPRYYANIPSPIFECKEETNKFISNCNYYLKKEILGKKTIETHGLKSRKYFKFSMNYPNGIKYTIITKEVNGQYIFIYSVKQNDITTTVTIAWDDYDKFKEKKQPCKICIEDDIGNSNEYIKGKVLYKDVKNKKYLVNYDKIIDKIKENDINLGIIDSIRKQTIKGIDLPETIPEILKEYFNHEIAQYKREQIIKTINQNNIQNKEEQFNKEGFIHHHRM